MAAAVTICPKCGGTGLADAVLTPEELARAIVHKTVKCAMCEGAGIAEEFDPARLAWAGECYRLNGVRLLSTDGQLTAIGLWSDLDGPHIREAIAIFGNADIPIRYVDGPNIPMKYKVRKMKGTPVTLEIVAAMDKANAEGRPAWEVRDKMLAEIKWHPKVYIYTPG